MAAATANIRERVGKLIGMLGSDHSGERSNALAAIEQTLTKAGTTWAWVGSIVSHGDLPRGEREQILGSLIGDRLRGGLSHSWTLSGDEARTLRETAARCKTSLASVSADELSHAIKIADEARRRAGARQ
jgi:hypothetical protein